MERDRRANAVVFGFDFQVNAAIVLMLENIKELNFLRLEGKEDIELGLSDGSEILAQAKAIVNSSSDFKNVRANLKKALASLSDGAKRCDAKELILITNSPNPFNDQKNSFIFWGPAQRTFDTLPETSKKLIIDYLSEIKEPLDTSKFKIQILPFETDNKKERYKAVKSAIEEFVSQLCLSIPGISSELMEIWQNDVFYDGTRKNDEIKLYKKDIIWPILVIATDARRCDDAFLEEFDSGLYDEIIHKYKDVIDTCCEKYEFFIKILADYQNFFCEKKPREKCREFALTQWKNYIDEFPMNSADDEIQKGLIQLVLYQIVTNRFTINKIKKGVCL